MTKDTEREFLAEAARRETAPGSTIRVATSERPKPRAVPSPAPWTPLQREVVRRWFPGVPLVSKDELRARRSLVAGAPKGRKRSKVTKLARLMVDGDCRCFYCGRKVRIAPMGEVHAQYSATVEHLKPLCFGGADSYSNLAVACHRCNTARGAAWHLSWLGQWAGQLLFVAYALAKARIVYWWRHAV